MSNINGAIRDIHILDEMSGQDTWLTRIHPLAKLIITFLYIAVLVSFSKYNLTGILSMSLYLIFMLHAGEISVKMILRQLKVIMLLLLFVGIANPFVDRSIVGYLGNMPVRSGMISFITLYLKGIFALTASYILIASTRMENICYALRLIKVPKLMVTVILLIYRYIILLLKEVERISLAYSLRAPKQKGIQYKAWGSLVGLLLLRSMNRSEMVYESMLLRGFNGEFKIKGVPNNVSGKKSIFFAIAVCLGILVLRVVPVFELVGNIGRYL